METDPTRMCALIVGLPEVVVLAVDDVAGDPIVVHVEQAGDRPACPDCDSSSKVKDRPKVTLADLQAFGRPARLVWHKYRLECPDVSCAKGSWTWDDPRIGWPRHAMTDRAGRWATEQVGRMGRSINEVAGELDVDWHTLSDAVIAYGTALVERSERTEVATVALSLDETLFVRRGAWHRQEFVTSIVDVSPGQAAQLLDIVEGRTAAAPSGWICARSPQWRAGIAWCCLDLSGPYRKTFNDTLPEAAQIADPFHLIKLANQKLDECRRRVQNETLGHRGHKTDPLYRARRLLTKAAERVDDKGKTKLVGLLAAGDPKGEVKEAWHAKEIVRSIYDITDVETAEEFVCELAIDLQVQSRPVEVRSLGRTLARWFDEITNWHKASVTNGPTEAVNNLIKRIKRIGFGFRSFAHYRIRVLLYAGKPDWSLLPTITPR